MKLENLNNFSTDKLQQVIEERFGQKVELNELYLFNFITKRNYIIFEKSFSVNI